MRWDELIIYFFLTTNLTLEGVRTCKLKTNNMCSKCNIHLYVSLRNAIVLETSTLNGKKWCFMCWTVFQISRYLYFVMLITHLSLSILFLTIIILTKINCSNFLITNVLLSYVLLFVKCENSRITLKWEILFYFNFFFIICTDIVMQI